MKKQILVVEDNAVNLELATDLLEVNGFAVHPATTAEQALRRARELLPDLILMDVSLPGVDGLAATRVLRADPATQHLTIVALTAHAMRGDEELALAAGCDGYLSKPIDTRSFASKIAAFIAAASARRAESAAACNYAH
jgi:CheY-like chemotaxis protein